MYLQGQFNNHQEFQEIQDLQSQQTTSFVSPCQSQQGLQTLYVRKQNIQSQDQELQDRGCQFEVIKNEKLFQALEFEKLVKQLQLIFVKSFDEIFLAIKNWTTAISYTSFIPNIQNFEEFIDFSSESKNYSEIILNELIDLGHQTRNHVDLFSSKIQSSEIKVIVVDQQKKKQFSVECHPDLKILGLIYELTNELSVDHVLLFVNQVQLNQFQSFREAGIQNNFVLEAKCLNFLDDPMDQEQIE